VVPSRQRVHFVEPGNMSGWPPRLGNVSKFAGDTEAHTIRTSLKV
jgi:hypothetical protein